MTGQSAGATFEALVEAVPDALLAVDAQGRVALANARTGALFGYSREELIGHSVETVIPDAGGVIQAFLEAPAQTERLGSTWELTGRRQDGSEFPAEISLSSVDTDEGVLVTATVRDGTGRQRNEAKFRGLLEAAPDAILGVVADGSISLVNAQAERLFGYSREELVGQAIEVLVPDSAKSVHPARREEYFADPVPRPMGVGMQLAGRRKDGSEFPAEISLSSIHTDEGVLVSAAVRDVTERLEAQAEGERLRAHAERKRVEAQMQQSQRLESLGQLAGGVAHDFNNLLAVILNYNMFIIEEIDKLAAEDPARWGPVRRDLDQVRRSGERATELTHQLLAFGRRELVRPQALDLNQVLEGVEPLLRRTLGGHIELHIDAAAELWSVLADPGQLEQVLVNLAINARDAMPTGGTLLIDTSNLEVDEAYAQARPGISPGPYVRLRVSDSGAGMPPEVAQRAFEPFFTTKPKGEGSGLGLATVYGIVSQAGGYAQIYSTPGHGTTFTAVLPATELSPAAFVRSHEQPHSVADGQETILLVEDEDAMREVTRRILTRHGHTVLVAAEGAEALKLAKRHPDRIDLVLTDVIMPSMLGKEVAERIQQLHPEAGALYMSGYAQPVLASQGTLEEGVALVEKPFSEATLLARVRQVLDR